MKISSLLILPALFLIAACSKSTVITQNNGGGTGPASGPTVTTFAGTGSAGDQNGTKLQASFSGPTGVALTSAGALVIADKQNNSIRLITSTGVVSTLAGTGTSGFTNSGTTSTFNLPSGVAINTNGDIFIADQGNNAIRVISAAGVVSTLAGDGKTGLVNASDTAARFSSPTGLAVDAVGNLYVADKGNNVIRKIDLDGGVTTFAGNGKVGAANGSGTTASFNQPTALVIDPNGDIYVADYGNNLIRMITPDGEVSTLAGSGSAGASNGKGVGASFNGPAGLAIDSGGHIYVGDSNNNLIREISSTGSVITVAGTGTAGATNSAALSSTFSSPQGLVINGFGTIYIVDSANSLIREIQL